MDRRKFTVGVATVSLSSLTGCLDLFSSSESDEGEQDDEEEQNQYISSEQLQVENMRDEETYSVQYELFSNDTTVLTENYFVVGERKMYKFENEEREEKQLRTPDSNYTLINNSGLQVSESEKIDQFEEEFFSFLSTIDLNSENEVIGSQTNDIYLDRGSTIRDSVGQGKAEEIEQGLELEYAIPEERLEISITYSTNVNEELSVDEQFTDIVEIESLADHVIQTTSGRENYVVEVNSIEVDQIFVTVGGFDSEGNIQQDSMIIEQTGRFVLEDLDIDMVEEGRVTVSYRIGEEYVTVEQLDF